MESDAIIENKIFYNSCLENSFRVSHTFHNPYYYYFLKIKIPLFNFKSLKKTPIFKFK